MLQIEEHNYDAIKMVVTQACSSKSHWRVSQKEQRAVSYMQGTEEELLLWLSLQAFLRTLCPASDMA